ncbi:magnesium transporter [Olivibacter domesticus]|uniref:Magnesium transporter MgtE n=1 Tax=Olivibacter domesticus TaxID=407022 RepID=A0A1H7LGK5_OLID1|nr:magnesium transporter [Olivibacter domesticus]SEK98094.1 magnesium transporter [Olivibacter domesticus]
MENNLDTLVEQIELLIAEGDKEQIQEYLDNLNISEVEDLIDELPEYGATFIETLSINRAVNVFRILDFPTQERIIKKLSGPKITELINELPPDDRTAFFSELHGDVVKKMIILMPQEERKEALTLLGYPEDSVGRLMTPDYVAVKQDYTVGQALDHIRKYGKNSETIDVIYVIDNSGVLLDDIRIREIILSVPETKIADLMDNRLIALNAFDPQEEAINIFRMNNRVALPVTDKQGIMLGIVTVDDVLWIANEEYTEDIQRMGGSEALDEPYLDVSVWQLVKKRAPWLMVLFIGQFFTATVIEGYEMQLQAAVVLMTFVPLITSSGGNTGSQASALIIQAMAMGEVTLADWFRVFRRELASGLILGIILGTLGLLRIFGYHLFGEYGDTWFLLSLVVGCSLVGVILWGSLVGAMLPFLLRRLGADPATSSAPFVATLVDVTGLVIYFTVATLILKGTLL